ncbi:MAG: fibronectin type III domain-containing protein [Bacteriovoracaceae bacterium]|nr:fibronectin type III domain-containing protein [Bacteriovoracaceae bacterium]
MTKELNTMIRRNIEGFRMKANFAILLVILFITSCVGTIQDSSKLVSEASIVKPVVLSFAGISKAVATSHNRIQLYFKPASGGSNNYSYLVYQDGNLSNPVSSVSQTELILDQNGEYSLPVSSNLIIGTTYTFLVRSFDSKYNTQDTNNVQVTIKTLDYKTPLFDGIQSVENLSGKLGETSLLIKWNKAESASASGGIFGGNSDSISGYNIYLGTSEETLTFQTSVNDPNATSFNLTGLDVGKLYYLRIRAKNSLSVPIEDLNSKFIAKKTLTSLPILFGGISTISIPSTSAGFSTINLTWSPGTGNYDRYKVFASKDPVSSFNTSAVDKLITTITDLSQNQVSINVPDAHTVWYLAVVACSDSGCTNSQGQNIIKYIKTSPPVASFNGIKALTQPLGGEGLSALDIVWDLPDGNSGVYDEIRIYKSDINGNFDPFLNRIDNITYDVGNPSTIGVSLRSSTFLRVNGLPTGTQSCFVALAYSTSPIDPANPDGRTGLTRVVKCATPQYNIPGFSGVKLGCTNQTAKTFKVSWNIPSPRGTYEDFEIYYKEGSSGFDISAALAGAIGYTKKVVTSDQLNYTLTNLLMNTTYQILVKSHFYNSVNNTHYRDNNSIVTTCLTSSPLVAQGPWHELFAIGPKFNGLNGMPIPEKLTPISGAIDGKTDLSINKDQWKHQYPIESQGTDLGVSESTDGIIRISWEDMILSDDLGKLRDYNSVPNTGYKVYRVLHNPVFGSTGPTLTDNAWVLAHTGFIQAPSVDMNLFNRFSTAPVNKAFAQFVDYSLIHPYNIDIARANEATVYWYKIEPWYNGKKLSYSTISSDAVVRMILPPKNTSFIHRWMSNKQICDDMGLPYYRSNQYKCEYTGLGAVYDSVEGKYYYDMKGDMLVDRFEMGCNFSRGGSTYQCTNTGGLVGFEGDLDDASTGRKIGDCVIKSASNNPTGKITAKQGSVLYSRSTQACYVNTSNGVGTTWKALQEIDGNVYDARAYYEAGVANSLVINKGLTKIPPTYSTTTSSDLPMTVSNNYYSGYSQGVGYGAKIYSNDAKLPALIKWTDPISLHYTCQSHTVSLNSVSYPKKLSRRKEFIAYAAESPLLNQTDRQNLERGSAQYTNDNPLAPVKNYLTMSILEHNDRDCNSTYNFYGFYNTADGKIYNDTSFTLFSGNYNYVTKVKTGNLALGHINTGTFLDYNDPRWVTGGSAGEYSMVSTGSSGPLSTEACTSRFGVQDHIGNASEWNSDLFYCNPLYGCSMAFKDAAKTTTYTPPIDPTNKENYKNANGEYYSVTDSSSGSPGTTSMGTKLLPRLIYSSPSRNTTTDFICWLYTGNAIAMTGVDCAATNVNYSGATQYSSAKYFNVALGLPLDCEGGTCTYDGGNDTNTLVSARSLPPSATTLITRYQAGSTEMTQIAGGGVSGNKANFPSILGIVSGGDPRTGGTASRYNILFNGHDGYMHLSTGRCSVLLPENY